jgi:hypothetical protein
MELSRLEISLASSVVKGLGWRFSACRKYYPPLDDAEVGQRKMGGGLSVLFPINPF